MRTVDLFCGCGGMSLGFEIAGFEIVGAFDNWESAVDVYNQNFQHSAEVLDLSKKNIALATIRPLNPEIIVGGPPCQDFSSAGERQEGERANLTISFAKIVKNIRPNYFVMENVSRARTSLAYAKAKELFKSAGYGITEIVLDASKCNVPQKRKRFFCIGALNEKDDFLRNYLLDNQSVSPLTVRKYFDENQLSIDFDYYYRHPRTYSRRAVYSVDEPSPTVRGVNRPRPAEYNPHPNDASVEKTITALSFRQRAIIQTFPPKFNFNASLAQIEQMIGNAVPVNLARHVAKSILAFEQQKAIVLGFENWLHEHYDFAQSTTNNIKLRVVRCNKILTIDKYNLPTYIKTFEKKEEFLTLPPLVRAKLIRALNLYFKFLISLKGKEHSG